MRVAQIPGLIAPFEHCPVVLLGIPDQSRVLLGKEVLISSNSTVSGRVLSSSTTQIDQLRHDVVFTRARGSDRRSICVGLSVLCEILEAAVSVARPLRGGRIDPPEVG